ncbi:hypothetical protein [Blastococcus brunescens]|uniref:Uncharacterized protein n=1 Tax=Blastococcus brunescens TaxID=1564165 RepID=A0ABZ1AYA6_9ACTN|nr:hypothetical protein [Blastococcus sp. BMG 8361]WRL63549.1 hypothetical protein U6N30_28265 [Blastococcus sp. BMG 8361]
MTTTFTRMIANFGGMVLHSVRTARAYDNAGSDAARREVLHRYLVESAEYQPTVEDRHVPAVDNRRLLSPIKGRFAA